MPKRKVGEIKEIIDREIVPEVSIDELRRVTKALLSWHSAELCRELESIMQEYWSEPDGAYTTIIKAKIEKYRSERISNAKE